MKIRDHSELFKQQDYQEQFERKKEFENCWPAEKVKEISEWTKTEEYKELNFKRQNIKINPAKACQPLGAVFCASGFEGSMPFVQGAQGCVAYFRSHLTRHFKEPFAAISTSMTEDAAVFGGLNNMLEGLENAYALYKPKMIAVSTTCMAEVIGDDLNAYIKTATREGRDPPGPADAVRAHAEFRGFPHRGLRQHAEGHPEACSPRARRANRTGRSTLFRASIPIPGTITRSSG